MCQAPDIVVHSQFTGSILLALNPYEKLDVYGEQHMRAVGGKPLARNQPHVYAITEEAHRKLVRDGTPQSIVVSGDSGAGKTETNKFVLRYLAWRCPSPAMAAGQHDLAISLMQSNPVLEAFGNAKTGRNANSSRFGKFIKLQFGSCGAVASAQIRTYLLERPRVSEVALGERSYHIFYQASRQPH